MPSVGAFVPGFSRDNFVLPLPHRAPPPLVSPTRSAPEPDLLSPARWFQVPLVAGPTPVARWLVRHWHPDYRRLPPVPLEEAKSAAVAAIYDDRQSADDLEGQKRRWALAASYTLAVRDRLRTLLQERIFAELNALRYDLASLRTWNQGGLLRCDLCERLYRYCQVPLPLTEASDPFWVGDCLSHWDLRPHVLTLVAKDAALAASAWSAGVPLRDATMWISFWGKGSGFIVHKCLWRQRRGLSVPDFLHFSEDRCFEVERNVAIHNRQVTWVRRCFQNGGGCVFCNQRYAVTRCVAKAPGAMPPLHTLSLGAGLCDVCAYVCDCIDDLAWCPACVSCATPECELTTCACGTNLCFRCNKGLTEPQCWECWLKT